MTRITGTRLLLLTAFCAAVAACLLVPVMGMTQKSPSNQVRMEVDPTVLPPVTADGMLLEPAESQEQRESVVEGDSGKLAFENNLAPDSMTPDTKPVPKSAPPVAKAAEKKVAPKVKPAAKAKPVVRAPKDPALGGVVKKIALRSTDDDFAVTITAKGPVGDTTYLNLSNPRRLVIDLRGPWKLGTKNVVRSATGMVKHIVVGVHKDRVRLVLHFRKPPTSRLEPKFERIGNKLVVSATVSGR